MAWKCFAARVLSVLLCSVHLCSVLHLNVMDWRCCCVQALMNALEGALSKGMDEKAQIMLEGLAEASPLPLARHLWRESCCATTT